MADYLPFREDVFLRWLENFAAKLPGYQALLGLPAAEVAAVQADLEMYRYLSQALGTLRPDLQEFTAYRRLMRYGRPGAAGGIVPTVSLLPEPPAAVPPGIEARVRSLAQRIKNHPAYTPSIGVDLGIVMTPPSARAAEPKPDFRLLALPNSEVRLEWTKGGFTGVRLESRRAAETAWTYLGIDLESPYVDARPPLAPGQPEVRHYRLRYLKGDQLVGDYSGIRTVTTVP